MILQYEFKAKNLCRVGRNFCLIMHIVVFCRTKIDDYLVLLYLKTLKPRSKLVYRYEIDIPTCVCVCEIVNRYCSIEKTGFKRDI